MATEDLLAFLNGNEYWGVPLSEEKQQLVKTFVLELIQKYGAKKLGFPKKEGVTLGPILKRFGFRLVPTKSHKNNEKIIQKMEDVV